MSTVLRCRIKLVVLLYTLSVAPFCHAGGSAVALSGVVRDAKGTPQMGAVVQVLSADTAVQATAYTDLEGRYQLRSLNPGVYNVRATAALFLPAIRSRIHLLKGRRSVVNLTLSGLFEETSWLPARGRNLEEERDDWRWTLRSSSNRPILKLSGDDLEDQASSSVEPRTPSTARSGRLAVGEGSGRFGRGGLQASATFHDLRSFGASLASARVSLGAPNEVADSAVPFSVSTTFQQGSMQHGLLTTHVGFQSLPVEQHGANIREAQVSVASGESFSIGNSLDLEVGSSLDAIRVGDASALHGFPFVKVAIHPSGKWSVQYSFASDPALQGIEAAAGDRQMTAATNDAGHLETEGGSHNEIAVSHLAGGRFIQVSSFGDSMHHVAIGGFASSQGDIAAFRNFKNSLQADSLLFDPSSGTFRFLVDGYHARGLNVLLTQEVAPGTWLAVQYTNADGVVQVDRDQQSAPSQKGFAARRASAFTVALRSASRRTGTRVRASYRWQPAELLSPAGPYEQIEDGGYLSFRIRQPFHANCLPDGMEMTLDGENLLAEGYRRLPAAQDRSSVLAASTRSLRAGLAFNF